MKKICIILTFLGGVLFGEDSWATSFEFATLPTFCGWRSSGNLLELCCSSDTICTCNQHGVAEHEVTLPLCSIMGFSCTAATVDQSLCNDDLQFYIPRPTRFVFGKSYLTCPGHTFPTGESCNPSEYPSN